MDICTIIAKNYIAQARVLAHSFLNHHPQGRVWTLIIDDFAEYLDPSQEPFEILTPTEIGCEVFEDMAARYNVLELSTAVKPWLLGHLLKQGIAAITYLDPDIRVYGSLTRLDELARKHGIVLTPHNTKGIPSDGHRPTQVDILIAGVYNLGYVSFGAGSDTDEVIEWWADRLLRDCRVDPVYGYFVDQRWFDLVPGLVSDYRVVRDPEYNLAYWNVHQHDLTYADDTYLVDGRELGFYHFSGFDPQTPNTLSRHQTRVRLSERPELRRLCDDYAKEVISAGYVDARKWPYTYDRLPDGTRFTELLRQLYIAGEKAGEVAGSPFTNDGYKVFLQWLREVPADGPTRLNRALASIYNGRADLRTAYPDVTNSDYTRFLSWAKQSTDPELALPASLLPNDDDPAMAPSKSPALGHEPWGVNVVGYFRSELGVGEAARQAVNALDSVGVAVLPIHGRTIPPSRQGHEYIHLAPPAAHFPVNLLCMNADALPEFAAQVAPDHFFEGRYSIGMWFWELSGFPDRWKGSFGFLDEIWAPTRHIADAVSQVSPIPVIHMPIPVAMSSTTRRPRALLGLPAGFVFLFVFDYYSVFERKNPLALIEAFRQAFRGQSGVSLAIKFMNETSDPVNHERLIQAADDTANVHLLAGDLSPDEKNSLMVSSDCYVSLHRAEGFGLTMAEAMYLGKPVIATGYSGNCDFMNSTNSLLVKYEMVSIGPDASPYPPDGEWAEPDVTQAAQFMRSVFDDQPAAARLGSRAAADIRSTHSPVVAGERMVRRLTAIRASASSATSVIARDSFDALGRRLAQGPVPASSRRGPSVRGFARRMVLRVIKPFTAYQESVNQGLLQVVEQLQQDCDYGVAAGLLGIRRQQQSMATLQGAVVERLDRLQGDTDALTALSKPIVDRLDAVDGVVQKFASEAHAIPYMEGTPFLAVRHPVAGMVQGYVDSEESSANLYRVFEDTFRGREEFIRERQRRYVDILDGREPVLDFGCGRGEFLDLLREAGLDYLGVDSDVGMAERCHEKGHVKVVVDDGLDYLERLQSGSLGAVFLAQVIEHLPYEQLLRLLMASQDKLRDDGLLIMETVNPHSIAAMKAFWVDPTHQHPLFPEVALALCRASGFRSAFMFHPNGTGDVEQDRFNQGEYAVVAGRDVIASVTSTDRDEMPGKLGLPEA